MRHPCTSVHLSRGRLAIRASIAASAAAADLDPRLLRRAISAFDRAPFTAAGPTAVARLVPSGDDLAATLRPEFDALGADPQRTCVALHAARCTPRTLTPPRVRVRFPARWATTHEPCGGRRRSLPACDTSACRYPS